MLVTLVEMKAYLGEVTTTYDTFLTDQLNLFSSTVENYCCRVFAQTSWKQTYYKSDFARENDGHKLDAFHYPVISVTSVKEVDADDVATTLLPSDYRVNGAVGFFQRFISGMKSLWFLRLPYDSRVEVIYVAGYATIPLEIQSVVKSLVEERYNKKKAGIEINFGSDIQRMSIPGVMSIDFDYTLQANERKTKFGTLLGNSVNILDSFRSERALGITIRENSYYVVQP